VVVGIAGGVLLGLASVGNDSPGAVDNASGVATVLAAAARLGSGAAVGVLITDAEEVGLAGAHAWARDRRPGVAVNCDTVDDHGAFRVLSAGGGSREVVRAARAARDRCGVDVRAGRTPAGVLTDATALAGAGWASATLSRATFGTLMRIHTPRDSVGMLEGRSIDQAAALLAATVEELL
jgi:putative aminopeptidase FrvX